MIAGVIVASTLGRIRVTDTVFAATQGIHRVHDRARHSGVHRARSGNAMARVCARLMSTIVMAALVGWLLTRWQVLPGRARSGVPLREAPRQ